MGKRKGVEQEIEDEISDAPDSDEEEGASETGENSEESGESGESDDDEEDPPPPPVPPPKAKKAKVTAAESSKAEKSSKVSKAPRKALATKNNKVVNTKKAGLSTEKANVDEKKKKNQKQTGGGGPRTPLRPYRKISDVKLIALIRDGKDRVETANLNLHTYMVRLKRYNTELKLRGGAEAIGGDEDDDNGNVSTMIGNTDDVSDGEN